MTRSKSRAKSSGPPQKRGRKATIKGFQKTSIDSLFVAQFVIQALSSQKGAVKEKTKIIDNCAKYIRAKYGSRDPWRALEQDRDEPAPGACTDADETDADREVEDSEPDEEEAGPSTQPATSLSAVARNDKDEAAKAGARLVAIRGVVGVYLQKCAKSAKDQAASLLVQNSEEGQKARLDAVIAAVVGSVRQKPERKPYLEAYAELYGEDDWEEDAEEEYETQRAKAEATGTKIPLAPHVRRNLVRERWFKAPEEERFHTREEIERQYNEAMEKYDSDASLQQQEPATPEEAANWAEDFGPVLGRAGQVFADGVKGCFFAMMASPRMTKDGRVEMEVSTVEWASVPKELGRRTFNYSSIDKKMVSKLTARFKYFGEKIFDANWTAEQFKRDAICRDLVEREASGKGVMDEPSEGPAIIPAASHSIAKDGSSNSLDGTPPRLLSSSERQPVSAGEPLSQSKPPPPEVPSSPPRMPSPGPPLSPRAPQLSAPPPPPPQVSPPPPELSAPTRHVSPDPRRNASAVPASGAKVPDLLQRSPAAPVARPSIPPQAAPRPKPVMRGAQEDAAPSAGATSASGEQTQDVGLQTAFGEYDSRAGLQLSPLQDASAFGLTLASAMKVLQGLPNDEAMFSGKAGWRKTIIEANDNCGENGWSVDTRIVQNLLADYLKFESEGPPVARSPFIGWSNFSLDGDACQMRPVWLVRFYAKDKFTARWCDIGSQERPDPGSRMLEWNFGTALTLQWAALQPEQRKSSTFVLTGPPQEDMDWQGAMGSGKMGVRTFVAALLMWAHVLPSCEDGSTSADWERLACDCIRVLRVRREQERAADRGAPKSDIGGGEAAKIGGRKRPKSAKALENELNQELSASEKEAQARSKKRKTAGV